MDELVIFDLETGVLDEPRDTDYLHEEVYEEFGGGWEWVQNRRTSIQNQNAQVETHYACPIYGLTHAINELNAMEGEKVGEVRTELSALENTRAIVSTKERWFNPKLWGSMQWAMDYARKRGWIDGYTVVRKRYGGNGDWMANALNNGFILYTGSGGIDWKNTCLSPGAICVLWTAYNHIICIDGWSIINWERAFHIRQSVWDKYYDKGHAYLLESQLHVLFTCYAITDKDDTNELYNHKAKRLGIYNGERDTDLATRLETATMFSRASWKPLSEIYNGERVGDIPTNVEMHAMTDRAFWVYNNDIKTRREVAAFAARNYKQP